MKIILQKNVVRMIFIIALSSLICSSLYAYQQIQRLIDANKLVVHTYQVIDKLNAIYVHMILNSQHQRAFIQSKNQLELIAFQKSLHRTEQDSNDLLILTQHNTQQLTKVKQLTDLVNDYTLNAEKYNTHFLSKSNDATLPSSAMHLSIASEIKHKIHDIKNVEMSLLYDRNNKSLINNVDSNKSLLFLGGLTLSLLSLSFILLGLQLNERLGAEQKSRAAKGQLKSIIEGTNDLIAALDLDMRYIIFNKAYKREIKKSYGKMIKIGMSLQEIMNDKNEKQKSLITHWERALGGDEFTLTEKLSDTVFYETTFNLIKDTSGNCTGASHIMRNVTTRIAEEQRLSLANNTLQTGVKTLEKRYREISLLNTMAEGLQSCLTVEEAYNPIKNFCQQVLPLSNGIVYLMHSSNAYLELGLSWGAPTIKHLTIALDDCWALRRHQIHTVENAKLCVICEHAKTSDGQSYPYICVPLIAQNVTLGLLYLELSKDLSINDAYPFLEDQDHLLISNTAEHISLALTNIRLRETLRFLSVRDPLTGLYNRRYLDETLTREFQRAERNHLKIAVVMIDIDHFKRFNDTYGHDTGDYVLKNVAQLFQKLTRASDVICRFGGEEFLIVLYDISYLSAKNYGESLRQAVSQLKLDYNNKTLSTVTISVGISLYPTDGLKPQVLIETADHALYKAKKQGRNSVVTVSHETLVASE